MQTHSPTTKKTKVKYARTIQDRWISCSFSKYRTKARRGDRVQNGVQLTMVVPHTARMGSIHDDVVAPMKCHVLGFHRFRQRTLHPKKKKKKFQQLRIHRHDILQYASS